MELNQYLIMENFDGKEKIFLKELLIRHENLFLEKKKNVHGGGNSIINSFIKKIP